MKRVASISAVAFAALTLLGCSVPPRESNETPKLELPQHMVDNSSEVIYIDHSHLHRVGDPNESLGRGPLLATPGSHPVIPVPPPVVPAPAIPPIPAPPATNPPPEAAASR